MDVAVTAIVPTLEEVRRTRVPVFDGCAGCGACLLTCPTHAIRPIGGSPQGAQASPVSLTALPDLCTGCGECVEVCPVDAVSLEVVPR
jgi:NAD-dependent dihydropyrimidine dehydrogenase PreA subunit